MTWADDDSQYTAYGDGYGFEPYTDVKLGLGFAQVHGGPTDFRGVNIRSGKRREPRPWPHGVKVNGLLMADGALYLWGRNAGNARLALSTGSRSDVDVERLEVERQLRLPVVPQLRPRFNARRARPTTSTSIRPTADSAYMPADRLVMLARVPKERRSSEPRRLRVLPVARFRRIDPSGRGGWPSGVTSSTFPGQCYRIRRHLQCWAGPRLPVPDRPGGEDPRFEGGLASTTPPSPGDRGPPHFHRMLGCRPG